MTDRPAPNVPASPSPTSIPPPSITNPLPQQSSSPPPPPSQATPTAASLASSASSASPSASSAPSTAASTAAVTSVTHVDTPAASITITNSVQQPASTAAAAAAVAAAKPAADAKEAIKVSNVPSVFVPPAFTNRPADYCEEDEESARPPPSRTRLSGSRPTAVPHMYDASRPSLTVELREDDLQWELRPSYLTQTQPQPQPQQGQSAAGSAEPSVVYLNAQNVAYYNQLLHSPRFTMWILIKNTSFLLNTQNNVGYVKRRLVETALRHNIQVLLMNPYHFDLAVSATGSSSIIYRGKSVQLPDCVIPRVGANVDYFGLAVLRQLEALGVLVFNPVNAIEISRDKLYTHQVLSAHGIPIPQTVLSRFPFEYDYIERHFTYPLIVKLASGSRGEAVWKLDSRAELSALLEKVDKSKPMIVQEFLQSTQGRDIRCLVVGDEVVASCMRVSSTSFLANYHAGGSTLAVAVSDGLRRMVVNASRKCGLSFSGVDVLLGDDGYRLCEVNSSPGFEGLERATGVDCAAAMIQHAVLEIERRSRDKAAAGPNEAAGEGKWRLREKEYPLQDDHLRIILEAKEREREAEAKAEEERAAAKADEVKAAPSAIPTVS